MKRPSRLLALLTLVAGVAGTATGASVAAFSSVTANTGNTFSAKQIFPGVRVTPAYDLRDAAGGGAEANQSNEMAFADGVFLTTGTWATAFSTVRYLDVDLGSPFPVGIPVTSAAFAFGFSSTAADTTCFYFEVRSRSTNAVLGTHGSAAAPVACAPGTAWVATTTPLAEVTTSTQANNLRVRVYERNSAGAASRVDLATATAAGLDLFPSGWTDASTGTPVATRWSLATSGDGASYTSAANWGKNYDPTRYLKATFPAIVVPGAVVQSVIFTHSYRDNNNAVFCYFFEVSSGGALLATHGSVAAPFCSNGGAFATDVVPLPEVASVTQANDVTVKMYSWNPTGSRRSLHDLVQLSIDYYLD